MDSFCLISMNLTSIMLGSLHTFYYCWKSTLLLVMRLFSCNGFSFGYNLLNLIVILLVYINSVRKTRNPWSVVTCTTSNHWVPFCFSWFEYCCWNFFFSWPWVNLLRIYKHLSQTFKWDSFFIKQIYLSLFQCWHICKFN